MKDTSTICNKEAFKLDLDALDRAILALRMREDLEPEPAKLLIAKNLLDDFHRIVLKKEVVLKPGGAISDTMMGIPFFENAYLPPDTMVVFDKYNKPIKVIKIERTA